MLLQKQELELLLVPSILKQDFVGMIMENYFHSCYHDLVKITELVEVISVYIESYNQTGNPHAFAGVGMSAKDEFDLYEKNRDILREDVFSVLQHHRMFFAYRDNSVGDDYDFSHQCWNVPFQAVW